MSAIEWAGPGGTVATPTTGEYAVATNWSPATVPRAADDVDLGAGTYVVNETGNGSIASLSVAAGSTFAIALDLSSMNQTNSTFSVENGIINNGGISVTAIDLEFGGVLSNYGSLVTSAYPNGYGGYYYPHISGTIKNNGSFFNGTGVHVTFDSLNLSNGDLIGGIWNLQEDSSLNIGSITTLDAVAQIYGQHADLSGIQGTLTRIGSAGSLQLIGDGYNYTTSNAIQLAGELRELGGRLRSGEIAGLAGSTFGGYGYIYSNVATAGIVRAVVAPNFLPSNVSRTLDFLGDNSFSGTIGGRGVVEFGRGSDLLQTGIRIVSPSFLMSGAAVTLAADFTYAGNLNFSAGSLDLGGFNAAFTGPASLSRATVSGGGKLALHGTTAIGGGTSVSDGAALNNYQDVDQTGRLTLTNSTVSNGGIWTQTNRATSLMATAASFSNTGTVNQSGQINLDDSFVVNRETWNLSGGSSVLLSSGGTGAFTNNGTLRQSGTGVSTIGVDLGNDGAVEITSGALYVRGAVRGHGTFEIADDAVLEFRGAVAATQTVTLDAGAATLSLDNGRSFKGTVAGLTGDATIDLGSFDTAGAKLAYTANRGNTGGVLEVRSGLSIADIALAGQYLLSAFHATADGHGGTDITYGSQQQQAQLAVGHS